VKQGRSSCLGPLNVWLPLCGPALSQPSKSGSVRPTKNNKPSNQNPLLLAAALAFRPPAEDVSERLEEFFPDIDLDRPIIESGSSGSSSPTNEDYIQILPLSGDVSPPRRSQSKCRKSTCSAAAEIKPSLDAPNTSKATPTPRRTTKLWGSKIEQVAPHPGPCISLPSPPENERTGFLST
jgi:hypothetical protein